MKAALTLLDFIDFQVHKKTSKPLQTKQTNNQEKTTPPPKKTQPTKNPSKLPCFFPSLVPFFQLTLLENE